MVTPLSFVSPIHLTVFGVSTIHYLCPKFGFFRVRFQMKNLIHRLIRDEMIDEKTSTIETKQRLCRGSKDWG